MSDGTTIRVERWPTEIPLLCLVAIASIVIWILVALSVIGLIYAAVLGIFFFLGHVGFIAWVRGNAVKLGPDQFPHLHERVLDLSARLGMKRPPDAYIMQAGGVLNALATKFLRSDFIILFSDLLDACGENTQARDMIVAHELGHLRAGHLRWIWLILPGYLVPFLGSALSRAREYTADRYGIAACEDRTSAIRGMSILAVGGRRGPVVNLESLVAQSRDLDTGWMTLGTWLSTHPPLAHRIAAIAPETAGRLAPGHRGAVRVVAGMLVFLACASLSTALFIRKLVPEFRRAMEEAQAAARATTRGVPLTEEQVAGYSARARQDMLAIAALLEEQRAVGPLPADPEGLRDLWVDRRPDHDFPRDPFDGFWYGYEVDAATYVLWSAGRDEGGDDDIVYDSGIGGFR